MKVGKPLILFLSILIVSLLVVLLSPYDAYLVDTANRNLGFSLSHLLGTDSLGRDFLLRLSLGSLISTTLALLTAFISLALALIIGLTASNNHYFDLLVLRLLDGIKAIPGFILALFFMSLNKGGYFNCLIILVIISLPSFVYLVKQSADGVKGELFVEAEYSLGASKSYIMYHTIIPHIREQLASQFAFVFSSSVLIEASLSYLGVGIIPPLPSLGNLLMNGKEAIFNNPFQVIAPSFVLFIITLSIRKVGEYISSASSNSN